VSTTYLEWHDARKNGKGVAFLKFSGGRTRDFENVVVVDILENLSKVMLRMMSEGGSGKIFWYLNFKCLIYQASKMIKQDQ
jgi:hypothetical protein